MTNPEPAGVGTADQTPEALAGAIIRINDEDWDTFYNRTALEPIDAWPVAARDLLIAIAEIIRAERSAITAAESRAMERCAKIADIFANTKPNLEKSDNPTTARTIAAIISDTGQKIAERIRSSINPPGEEE